MPPNRWPITTTGLSSNVTVHMPSIAWKMITASASTQIFHASGRRNLIAANSGSAIATTANTDDQTCSPRMYSATPSRGKHRTGEHRHPGHTRTPSCQQRQQQHQPAERAGQEAVHLLAPGLVRFERPIGERSVGAGNLLRVLGPRHFAIAGRPIRTRQAGVGQPYEAAKHHQAKGKHRSQRRQSAQHARRTRAHQRITLRMSRNRLAASMPAGYNDSAVPLDSTSTALTLSAVAGR